MRVTSTPPAGHQSYTLLVWALFGMVVVLTLINLYQGWVIAHQMNELRRLSEILFGG